MSSSNTLENPNQNEERRLIIGQLVIKSLRLSRFKKVPDAEVMAVDVEAWMDELHDVPTDALNDLFRAALDARVDDEPLIAFDIKQQWRRKNGEAVQGTLLAAAVLDQQQREAEHEIKWRRGHTPQAEGAFRGFVGMLKRGVPMVCDCPPHLEPRRNGNFVWKHTSPTLNEQTGIWECGECGFRWDNGDVVNAPYPSVPTYEVDAEGKKLPMKTKRPPSHEEEAEGVTEEIDPLIEPVWD